MNAYKSEVREGTPEQLVTDAVSEYESLAEELRSWASNMEGSNLEGGEKYQALDEAASTLENVSMPEPDEWPHSEAKITWHESVPRRKKRSPSRAVRVDNARARVEAVRSFYEDLDDADDHQDLIGQLQEIEIEVEIPGMYG